MLFIKVFLYLFAWNEFQLTICFFYLISGSDILVYEELKGEILLKDCGNYVVRLNNFNEFSHHIFLNNITSVCIVVASYWTGQKQMDKIVYTLEEVVSKCSKKM